MAGLENVRPEKKHRARYRGHGHRTALARSRLVTDTEINGFELVLRHLSLLNHVVYWPGLYIGEDGPQIRRVRAGRWIWATISPTGYPRTGSAKSDTERPHKASTGAAQSLSSIRSLAMLYESSLFSQAKTRRLSWFAAGKMVPEPVKKSPTVSPGLALRFRRFL